MSFFFFVLFILIDLAILVGLVVLVLVLRSLLIRRLGTLFAPPWPFSSPSQFVRHTTKPKHDF